MGKATNVKFGRYIQSVHANKIQLKIWEKMERGRIQGLPNYLSYELQLWQVYSQGPSEQKPFKVLGENGAWAYPGTAQILWVPPIISGTGKATNFKFTHILCIDLNKSPLQLSGQVAGCVVRTMQTFQGTHILGASRGLLCDSSALLFSIHFQQLETSNKVNKCMS